jgi:hypothetical protein
MSAAAELPIEYIGSQQATGEGIRHFFMIPLIHAAYTAISGASISRMMVYTSTGKNTIGCNSTDRICLIPCFGTMTKMALEADGKMHIQGPIIKADYFSGMDAWMNSTSISRLIKTRWANIRELFLSGVSDSILQTYLGPSVNVNAYKDLKVKVGSDLIMQDILTCKSAILSQLPALNAHSKKYDDLTFLNRKIGINNFYGIDLSKLKPYRSMIKERGYDITVFFLPTTREERSRWDEIVKSQIQELNKTQPDKAMNILGSPIENEIAYWTVHSASAD